MKAWGRPGLILGRAEDTSFALETSRRERSKTENGDDEKDCCANGPRGSQRQLPPLRSWKLQLECCHPPGTWTQWCPEKGGESALGKRIFSKPRPSGSYFIGVKLSNAKQRQWARNVSQLADIILKRCAVRACPARVFSVNTTYSFGGDNEGSSGEKYEATTMDLGLYISWLIPQKDSACCPRGVC